MEDKNAQLRKETSPHRYGECIFVWDNHMRDTSLGFFPSLHLKPGDRIIILGEIQEIHMKRESNCNNESTKLVYKLSEMRKLES